METLDFKEPVESRGPEGGPTTGRGTSWQEEGGGMLVDKLSILSCSTN